MNLYLKGTFNIKYKSYTIRRMLLPQQTSKYLDAQALLDLSGKSNLFDKERYIPLCRKRIRWNEENFNLKTQINPQDYNVQINPQGSNVF